MKPKYLIILFVTAVFHLSFSDNSFKNNRLPDFTERIYLHTDRPLYFPGETIWFKAYVVGADNKVTRISDFIYVDLLSPKNEIIKTLKLYIEQGSTYGDFIIDKNLPGGMYTLRAYSYWMNNYGEESFFKKEIIVQKIVKPKLLMKLEFEKEAYGRNSEVIAKFDLKDLTNEVIKNKEIEYVVNIKGEKKLSGKINTSSQGKTDIKFSLPQNLASSDVILTILVPYNGNTESISRSVPVILDNIDLQFLPEGGYSLNGTENTIAFKALNEFGKPADFEAEILDAENNVLQKIESFHDGMGTFKYTPQKNKKYYAKIIKPFISEKKYELPEGEDNGYVLSLEKNDSSEIKFKIYSLKKANVLLSAKSLSTEILRKDLNLKKGWNEISFDAANFPLGMIEFTLYEDNMPQVERLVFANKSKGLHISVKTNKRIYSPREKVELEILTTNKAGKPIPADLSVTVADDKILSIADDKQDNILSYLLMSSGLKGTIEKPCFYFDPKEDKADRALDLVMLTNGWRTYYSENKIDISNAKYQPEQVAIESRTVVDKNENPVKATVLIIEQKEYGKVAKIETDETGFFRFRKELNHQYLIFAYRNDNKEVFIKKDFIPKKEVMLEKTKASDKNSKEIPQIGLQENQEVKQIKGEKKEEKKGNLVREKQSKKKKSDENLEINAGTTTMDLSEEALEECVIVGYGTQKKSDLTGSVVSVESVDVLTLPYISEGLQGRVAGIEVNNLYPGNSNNIRIRGSSSLSSNNKPLVIIDGIPAENLPGNDIISTLEFEDVETVSVLDNSSSSAIYGSRAANGVILITTKSKRINSSKSIGIGRRKKIAMETVNIDQREFHNTSRMFYVPLYNSNKPVKTRNDFRQTIYWNPIVQTNEEGKASINFYNSDAITSYRITAEGIGYNGLPGRNEETYGIQKPLSIDLKVPVFLSIGDTLEIPVIVSNNTNSNINAKISFQLPAEMILVNTVKDNLEVPAKEGVTQKLKVTPIRETSLANLSVAVEGEGFDDKFTQELSIISPLFPKVLSFAGNKSEKISFNLEDEIVPGTLNADFTLYFDVIGDVMNGIESILQQPHGCFEQVSSSAYPNVLVYKYLKESGKLTAGIEERAMNFITSGYNQLAAYETKEHGFEWYGGTPPHEVLSAYGIMEFTEMKEVYSGVDEQMIKRTINWLMTRKNGHGGFKQNRGRYGFSAAPENVNNAYIVYALSTKGLEADIENEYKATLSEALNSGDFYRLALLALASDNLGKKDNYYKISNLLIEKINWKDLSKLRAENSITRSYGNSLQVETAAFVALALMRDKNNLDYIQKSIDFILKNRQNGGSFGNTQATSMALKALIEYTKLHRTELLFSDNKPIVLKINDNELKIKPELNESGKMKLDGIEKYLKNGKQNVEVIFPDEESAVPYLLNLNWKTNLPASVGNCPLDFNTTVLQEDNRLGETVRMDISLTNQLESGIPMSTAVVGIPSGMSVQIWQLKELKEKGHFDYYEIMKNKLVFYWREMGPNETKRFSLDFQTDVRGSFTAEAGAAYLYYADEHKKWIKGNSVKVY